MGKVIFIGAGPGNPELLTLEAYRHLQSADIVLYDALVGEGVLGLIPAHIERLYVGKRATCHHKKQKEINELLVEKAQQHGRVVRLKGGDTLIYARLTDEITSLQQAGIGYQVLAGVTTCSGTAAALGIPLTSRDCGSELLITTVSSYASAENCQAIATLLNQNAGVAIYMPTFRGEHVLPNLLEAGVNPNLPLLLVVHATLPQQRLWTTTLGNTRYEQLREFSNRDPTIFLLGAPFSAYLSHAESQSVDVHVN